MDENALAIALHEYDVAAREEDFPAMAAATSKINALRDFTVEHNLEPSPTEAEKDADQEEDLLPIEQAHADQIPRTFRLNDGFSLRGTVTNVQPHRFTVRSGVQQWIVVRSAVQAIRLPDLPETPAE